jgi:phospholipid/cholesterol/gamma-HCH transport system substrate-binding protein
MMTGRLGRVLAGVLAAALLAGCGFGLEDLPAPSGTHGPTYKVTAQFRDVQNLTLGAKVKLGGVVVGEVDSISTADYLAAVKMKLEKEFKLGKDAHLQIRFTTPLGEDFISITSEGSVRHGVLAEGDTIPVRHTGDAPSIEDTFSAVSTLLNGGGLSKLRIIAGELDTAFKGRTGDARSALINLHKLIADLDDHKLDIDRTLDGMAQLAETLNRGTRVVEQALDLFPSTLQTLADDTQGIRQLLTRVDDLGGVVSGLLRRSQQSLLADLDNLRPTLDALRARRAELLPTFRSLILLGKSVQRAAPGDYLNISGTIQFLLNAPPARPQPGGVIHQGAEPTAAGPDAAVAALLTGGRR